MMLYMITIRKCQVKDKVIESDLDQVLYHLVESNNQISYLNFIIYKVADEAHGKYMQLHRHALILHPDKNRCTFYQGFRIYWSPIDANLQRVLNYITKHASDYCEQQAIYTLNDYSDYSFRPEENYVKA